MRVGYSDHPHARASSKCFLAYVPPEELELYVKKDALEPITPATITEWPDLLADLEGTRERGYALDHEEFNEGVGCLAAVLLGPEGDAMGAIAMSLPIDALHTRKDELAPYALDAGRRGSEVLGYRGPYPPDLV